MNSTEQNLFRGIQFFSGAASATLLAANLELSFWGGVDQKTGEVIDRFHPLSDCFLKDTNLEIPCGRGSCGGSMVMLELMLSGLGPKAFLFEPLEEILTLGIIVAEEFFNKTAPVVSLTSHRSPPLVLAKRGATQSQNTRRVRTFRAVA